MGCSSSTPGSTGPPAPEAEGEASSSSTGPLAPEARRVEPLASLCSTSSLGTFEYPFVKAMARRRTRKEAQRLERMHRKVLRLLNHEWPSLKNSSLLGTWRQRDSLMRGIGPPMALLHWETIEELGRIPRSSEGRHLSMEEAAAIAAHHDKRFFIEMFSHRWCSQNEPDDHLGSKASALIQWAKYRWTTGLATFFWVDYTCIDQDDIAPGVCMLPLYVSSCNNIICYDTPEYEPRAWCRVERLLFTAFVAPNSEFIGPDFTFDESAPRLANNELTPQFEESSALPDPEAGLLTRQEDAAVIRELKALCAEHWGKCWKDGLLEVVEGRLQGVRALELGATQVRLRRFAGARKATMHNLFSAGKAQDTCDDVSTACAGSDLEEQDLVTPQVSLCRASEDGHFQAPLRLVAEEEEQEAGSKATQRFRGAEPALVEEANECAFEELLASQEARASKSGPHREFDGSGVAKAPPPPPSASKPSWVSMLLCGPAPEDSGAGPQRPFFVQCCT